MLVPFEKPPQQAIPYNIKGMLAAFLGAMYFSILSLKKITLHFIIVAYGTKVSTAAISTIKSFLTGNRAE